MTLLEFPLEFPLILYSSIICTIGRIGVVLKVVFSFRHATHSHYHQDAGLITGTQHTKCLPGIFCLECVYDGVSSLCYCYLFCILWGSMVSTDLFEFRWLKRYICNPSYYHHQIRSIHFPIVFIFFHVCVSNVAVQSYSVICYIYIPRTLGLCFHY